MNAGFRVAQAILQTLSVGIPRHPVHTRRRVPLQPVRGLLKQQRVDVVQRVVNLSAFLSCAVSRTRSIPNSEVARSGARTPCEPPAFPSAPTLRSTRSSPGRPGSFVGFIALMAGSDFSLPFIADFGQSAFPTRTGGALTPPVGSEISRFPGKERPCMLGSATTPDRDATRDNVATCGAFRVRNPVGFRNFALSRLDGQPARSPTRRSSRRSIK